ncbi:carbon-nitrogen hydrolase family protein [Roseibium algicola]|nr:carbon-nitrogen hydrolase family protein [Roseibium aggregatum]
MKARLAAVHAPSEFFDPDAGIRKSIGLIKQAAAQQVDLIVFPESFVPGFPVWNSYLRPTDGHDLFARFADASLTVDGPEIAAIRDAARSAGIAVWFAFSERATYSSGCLWNSAVLIGPDGELCVHHRKLVPTFYEKLTWNRGDGAGLRVCQMSFGKVGGLICGENGNPLARYALMAQGEQIHCASYPSVWPFRDPRTSAAYDMSEATRIRAAAHSFEAKVYTVVSTSMFDDQSMQTVCGGDTDMRAMLSACRGGGAMIVAPDGSTPGGVLYGEEGLVIADVDISALTELKQHHDMAGYYNRHDIFRLEVDFKRQKPLYWADKTQNRTEVLLTMQDESFTLLD